MPVETRDTHIEGVRSKNNGEWGLQDATLNETVSFKGMQVRYLRSNTLPKREPLFSNLLLFSFTSKWLPPHSNSRSLYNPYKGVRVARFEKAQLIRHLLNGLKILVPRMSGQELVGPT